MRKQHALKGRKQSPETIAKRKATLAAKRAAKANGHDAPLPASHNAKDASVYLRHALAKWPKEKHKGIAHLYVELALATLEGKA